MLKIITTAFAWAATTAAVWAGETAPPAVNNDGGNEGLIALALIGVVIFAIAKGKGKPAESGAPEIVDAEDGAGTGKY